MQTVEKELKPIVAKLNDIERTQSPDSAFYTDQTRAKSGEFGYSPQSSDSDDIDLKMSTFEDHTKHLKDKFNSIDQMSQSMTVDIERRVITDIVDHDERFSESPSKSSTSSKEKKGFWERNFDSLKRKSKKPKSPEKVDIMSQSLNENLFYNDNIEADVSLDKFNSLRHSKKKEKDKNTGPVKSNSSSKIPTFAALGKIMKKDSFTKKSRDNSIKNDESDKENNSKNRYIKNPKSITVDNKYVKAKSLSPEKKEEDIEEEIGEVETEQRTKVTFETLTKTETTAQSAKILHRKSCGDEPSIKEFNKITDKVPSQDDIDRISKVTIDAPILSSDTDMNSLGKRTLDSLMEVERKRMEMLEEQGIYVVLFIIFMPLLTLKYEVVGILTLGGETRVENRTERKSVLCDFQTLVFLGFCSPSMKTMEKVFVSTAFDSNLYEILNRAKKELYVASKNDMTAIVKSKPPNILVTTMSTD